MQARSQPRGRTRRGGGPRRVVVVTGTRAEYGLLQSTLRAVARHPRLTLRVVVAGMHLIRRFGYTARQVERDGWPIAARVPMQRGDDSPQDQALGLSRGIAGIAPALERERADVVVVLGDRIEAMAGALAAVTTGRVLAHIHGGDVAPGDFDDSLRHAITKLAHLHLTATAAARRRVIGMGESPRRVHFVGAPGLDRLRELLREPRAVPRRGGRALIVHHATGRSAAQERETMDAILRAVRDVGLERTVILPNTDRGHTGILAAIEAHRRAVSSVEVHPSLDRDAFLRQLIAADVIVGNSSSGIIEAGLAGTPAVNVGERQAGREHGGSAVVDAAESYSAVRRALNQALTLGSRARPSGVYGRAPVGPRIARLLAAVSVDDAFRRKAAHFRQ